MTRSWTALLVHEFRYDLLTFLRNRQSTFFTLGLPVVFLVIFGSLFARNTVRIEGGLLNASVYYVPSLVAFGVISAAFVNLVTSVTAFREAGIYKRRRATPVPASVIIAGRAMTAVVTAIVIAVILLVIGRLAYGAVIPGRTALAFVIDIIAGAMAFCSLGYALTGIVRSVDSVQPITQGIVLPLYFISGVFVSTAVIPARLTHIANFFPILHLAQALLLAYNPYAQGSGFAWHDLAIVALWGVVGLIVALRRFHWIPLSR